MTGDDDDEMVTSGGSCGSGSILRLPKQVTKIVQQSL